MRRSSAMVEARRKGRWFPLVTASLGKVGSFETCIDTELRRMGGLPLSAAGLPELLDESVDTLRMVPGISCSMGLLSSADEDEMSESRLCGLTRPISGLPGRGGIDSSSPNISEGSLSIVGRLSGGGYARRCVGLSW